MLLFGTRGRTRTGTLLRAGDFESPVSTNFTTLALLSKAGRRLYQRSVIGQIMIYIFLLNWRLKGYIFVIMITRGWTDSEHLVDAPRGFTPPSRCFGALIAFAIGRTGTLLRAGDFESVYQFDRHGWRECNVCRRKTLPPLWQ